MSNKYLPHLQILSEDDANRQIVNGFLTDTRIDTRRAQVLQIAGGWSAAVGKINDAKLSSYPKRRLLLVIDFDDEPTDRLERISREIQASVRDRVYVLGVRSEPEKLKQALSGTSYEKIGKSLCKECSENTTSLWAHDLLKHNETELQRLLADVKPFLFVQ